MWRKGKEIMSIKYASRGIWNEETVVELSRLWLEGHSSRVIGEKIGFSKNAVVAKAHRCKLPARPSPIGKGENHYAADAAKLRPPKLRLPKAEKALKVFEAIPIKAVHKVPKPAQAPSLLGKAKGHREMPFGIGVLSGIDIARIKVPSKGACCWPFVCVNPTEGHFCEVHRTLIRAAA
jgi:GcrA cell cycle regulator